MSARRIIAVLGAGLAVVACTELGPAGVPASIAVERLPYPSVVVGDTLRNADGEVAPLGASVLDARNAPVPDAPIRWVAIDSGIEITAEGYVIGRTFGASPRLVAQVGALQSTPFTVFVTRRPDALHRVAPMEIAVEYGPGEVVTSSALEVRVVHDTPVAPGDTVVPRWIVRYEVVGQAPGDTVPGYLVTTNVARRASADTTESTGVASMQFRLNSATLPVLRDTIEVRASAQHRGEPLPGSPVSFHLLIRPRPTS